MSSKKAERTTLTTTTVTSHAFNKDRTQIAVSTNHPEVYIYSVEGNDSNKWELVHTLKQHLMTVLCVDWAEESNQIVSCAEDRSVYVWRFNKDKWSPVNTNLGPTNTRATLTCRWSPSEQKFAVGTGSTNIYVCYYEEENKWWIAKTIKSPQSSVTALAWKPGSDLVVASGGTDCKVALWSAYVKVVDGKVENSQKVGTELASVDVGAWVHSVAYSPDGKWIAAATHDSSIHFFDTTSEDLSLRHRILMKNLPHMCLVFPTNDLCIAGGHDFYPMAYKLSGGKFAPEGKWAEGGKVEAKAGSTAARAMAMFQEQEKFGGKKGDALKTKHHGCIASIGLVKAGGSYCFSTGGLDGALYIWKASEMGKL